MLGQASTVWPSAVKITSAFSVTAPVAPSMWSMTFWATVGVAHRNSPVSRSNVYTKPVLPGMPVITFRTSPGSMRGLIQLTASGSGATAVSTRMRSKGWSRSQWSFMCW